MNLTGMCRNDLTRLGLANRPRDDDDDAVKVQTRVLRTRTDGRKEGRGGRLGSTDNRKRKGGI